MNKAPRLLSMLLIALLLSASFPLLSLLTPASTDGTASADWTIVPSGTSETLYGIWGSAANDIWAVGAGGTILHWDGKTWTRADSATGETFRAVWGSSSTNVFTVGSTSTIRHWDGSTWSGMTDTTSLDLYGVWGDAANSVFTAGNMLSIFHWNGHEWEYWDIQLTTDSFYSVWGTSYNNVYLVGDSGRVHHYNGSSWNDIDIGAGAVTLNAVWGTSASDIYIAGNDGTLYHYNGSTWSSKILSSAPLHGIWGSSASNIFVAGDNGFITHYDGSNWTATNTGTSKHVNAVWGSSSTDIWAVGQDGTILHYGPSAKTSTISSGRGAVAFTVNTGFIDSVMNISIYETNCSNPLYYDFPYGLFSFNVTGIAAGATVEVTLNFAQPLPINVKYYKCIDNNMVDCTSLMRQLDNYTLVLSLTDGGLGDSDHSANGIIVDPGGPAQYVAPVTPQVYGPVYGQGTMTSVPQQAPVALSNILVKTASLSAAKVGPGEPVTVTANVTNTGTVNGTSSIKVYVNGELENSQGITVSSGSSTPLTFTISRDEPGAYSVYVGGTNAGSFTVDQFTPQTILIISGALVFFAFILGVIHMTRKKQAQ